MCPSMTAVPRVAPGRAPPDHHPSVRASSGTPKSPCGAHGLADDRGRDVQGREYARGSGSGPRAVSRATGREPGGTRPTLTGAMCTARGREDPPLTTRPMATPAHARAASPTACCGRWRAPAVSRVRAHRWAAGARSPTAHASGERRRQRGSRQASQPAASPSTTASEPATRTAVDRTPADVTGAAPAGTTRGSPLEAPVEDEELGLEDEEFGLEDGEFGLEDDKPRLEDEGGLPEPVPAWTFIPASCPERSSAHCRRSRRSRDRRPR